MDFTPDMDSDEMPSMYEPSFRHTVSEDIYLQRPSILSAKHHQPVIIEQDEDTNPSGPPHQHLQRDGTSEPDVDDEITSVLHEADVLLQMLQRSTRQDQSGKRMEAAVELEPTYPGTTTATATVVDPTSDISLESFFPFLKAHGVRFELEGAMPSTLAPIHDPLHIGAAATAVAATTSSPLLPLPSSTGRVSPTAGKGLGGNSSTATLEALLSKYKAYTLHHSTHNPSAVYLEAISQGVQHRASLRDSTILMHTLDANIQHRATHMTMWESSVRRWITEEEAFLAQFQVD